MPRWLATVAIVAVLLAVSAWVIGQQFGSSTVRHGHAAKGASLPMTTFKDPAGAFEVSYPTAWRRLQAISPRGSQVVLLAAGPEGASYEVQTTPIGAVVTAADLAAAEPLTNRIVKSGDDVKLIVQPKETSLGGLPGFLYLYTFRTSNGQIGAHAHYFLFDGKTMITLVFQSLPSQNLTSLAPTFDRIAQTFHTTG